MPYQLFDATLGLAVAEEAGELAQAIFQHLHEGGERDRIYEKAVDLGALCLKVMAHFSVEHGGAAPEGAPEGAPAGPVLGKDWRIKWTS